MRLRGGGDWDLDRRKGRDKKKNRRRDISGQALEKQMDEISEESYCNRRKRRRKYCIWGVILVALLLAIMIIAIIVAKKNNEAGNGTATSDTTNAPPPNNSNLQGLDPNSVAADKKGGWMDPWSWYNTNDFNVTYTPETVGGLPVIGLFDTWDDSNAPNDNVPNLKQPYPYGKTPFRGVNIGGWLSLEPFITPSLFRPYEKQGVVDEYTLTKLLGASQAKQTLEKHYDSFVTKNTFKEIAAAGLDHVRIPFPYWAIVTYPGDPYVPQVAWRYLLRSIEWARQYGLRIKLDLHAVPGSQNGWNHSGRQGSINWINGPDGAANAQRSLDIHDQLSKFFSQPRYANIVTLYGLVNEPKMIAIPVSAVNSWTVSAASIVRKNGFKGAIVFGDGFLGLDKWKGQLSGVQNAAVDVHDYTIFNTDQIAFPHREKAKFACAGWGSQIQKSMDTSTG